jgi:isoleucyl-tRNA synthetase
MRKAEDFEVTDKINIYFDGDEEVAQAIDAFRDYIMQETLALSIQRVNQPELEGQNLNDHLTGIEVERV